MSSVLPFLWDTSSFTHLQPNVPYFLHQNQITLSLTAFLLTETEFYELSSIESYLVPRPHIQSLKVIFILPSCLVLLFPLLPSLFRLLHLYYLLPESPAFCITKHSPSLPTAASQPPPTLRRLPSCLSYIQKFGGAPHSYRMVFQFLHNLTSDYFSILISHCS